MELKLNDNSVVQLYIPHRVKQCLTYELANISCVETLLKICDVKYEISETVNANFMSSSGYVPLVRYGKFLMNDYKSIVEFFSDRLILSPCAERTQSRGSIVTNQSDDTERKITTSYSELTMHCMIKELEDLEKFVCWLDEDTYRNETKVKYSTVHPFPLNYVIPFVDFQKMRAYLQEKGLPEGLSSKDVLDKFFTLLNVFSLHLSETFFLLGRKPKAVDTLLFGHLLALLSYRDDAESSMFHEVANYIAKNNDLMVFVGTLQRLISGV